MKEKIYVDFDGVIVNTIKAIVDLYNEDFSYYKKFKYVNWWEIDSWGFEECNCAKPEYIDTYFNQKRFFNKLECMPYALEVLNLLNLKYDIVVVSMGYTPNLKLKAEWVKDKLPFAKFKPVNFKEAKDKRHIDMSEGIFFDDSLNNLLTSNAKECILFGENYSWNKGWNGERCINWTDVRIKLL